MVKKISSAPPPPRYLSGAGRAMRTAPDPAPPADWSKWAQLLQVEVWQGVALSLGFEPVEERPRWGEPTYDSERYGPEFKSRLAVAVSHVRDGHPKLLDARGDAACDVVYLAHFARWAEQNMEWKLPERMVDLAWGTPVRDPARWRRRGTWTLHEAAHLLVGKEPVPPERFDVHASAHGPEQDLYAALKDAVGETKTLQCFPARATNALMLHRVEPAHVIAWAKRCGWTVSDALDAGQSVSSNDVTSMPPPQSGGKAEAIASEREGEPPSSEEEHISIIEARRIAREIVARDKAADRYPSQTELSKVIETRLRESGVMGKQGRPLSAASIERHALRGQDFIPTVRGKRGKRGKD